MSKEQTKAQAEETVYVNEFGVALYIDKKSVTALRERCKELRQVIETGIPIGDPKNSKPLSEKEVKRAKMHLGWYSAELRKLTGEAKPARKKAASKKTEKSDKAS